MNIIKGYVLRHVPLKLGAFLVSSSSPRSFCVPLYLWLVQGHYGERSIEMESSENDYIGGLVQSFLLLGDNKVGKEICKINFNQNTLVHRYKKVY
jgi:hypothetical protein